MTAFRTFRDNGSRARRVIGGLADPQSRPRYLEALKRRVRGERVTSNERGERCLVCGSPRLRYRTITYAADASKVSDTSTCEVCGFVRIVRETSQYREKTSLDQLTGKTTGKGVRVGTEDKPGREFRIAEMALEILGSDDTEVMVFGAGKSLDNVHIEALPQVSHVVIGDIMKLRDDAEFIDINLPAPRRFPVVIASEVVEHFREPREDFAKLFKFVEKDGLLVCGTNIYDGGDLAQDMYIFYPDHTSYYTPDALRRIATSAGYHLDFRSPGMGRKRYVLLSRSAKILERAAEYFGTRIWAPSELHPTGKPVPKKGPKKPAAT